MIYELDSMVRWVIPQYWWTGCDRESSKYDCAHGIVAVGVAVQRHKSNERVVVVVVVVVVAVVVEVVVGEVV